MKYNIVIRDWTMDDLTYIAEHLREDDVKEVEALLTSPRMAVLVSVYGADIAKVVTINGVPAGVFGVARANWQSPGSEVFFLGTPDLDKVPMAMVKMARKALDKLRKPYGPLFNHCHARYKKSLRWLKMLGFTIHSPKPWGPLGEDFCYIHISRGISRVPKTLEERIRIAEGRNNVCD